VQARLSGFDAGSDIARFNAMRRGGVLRIARSTAQVLAAARTLWAASDGAFDISLGTGPEGWRCDSDRLEKRDDAVRLDLGGIGKGHAVDCAVEALIAHGATSGWVNAGGDLRAFGEVAVPIRLRHEAEGGVQPFATLRDGAFATSHYGRGSRSHLFRSPQVAIGKPGEHTAHISVAAPHCLWADALTKLVALGGDTAHPLLARFDAQAWLH
jgi:FAD:protein FMN transferase